MNIERWVKLRKQTWEKLELLLRIVDNKGFRFLTHVQVQEFGKLYRATSADLSRARSWNLSGETISSLNALLVKAHNQIYQSPQNRWQDLARFLWFDFPMLVRKRWQYIAFATLLFLAAALTGYRYTQTDIQFAKLEYAPGHPLVDDQIWHIVQKHKIWTDSTEHFSPIASSLIATNNIRVSALAFASGITFGVGTLFVLLSNGLSIGTTFSVCQHYQVATALSAFVAPHGLLELTSIFISGGAGLLIGFSLLFPGNYGRLDALRLVSKEALLLFVGCVPLLLMAGLIEGFVSPRTDLDASMKYLVSLTTFVFLIAYLFVPRRKRSRE
jgi:uncharacterized membrane protein SpoIIM required for sporulation